MRQKKSISEKQQILVISRLKVALREKYRTSRENSLCKGQNQKSVSRMSDLWALRWHCIKNKSKKRARNQCQLTEITVPSMQKCRLNLCQAKMMIHINRCLL